MLKLQARHRRKLLNRRCQKREEASMQAAALVVQYFYRHKLRVGRRGALLANMALEAQQQVLTRTLPLPLPLTLTLTLP